MNINNYDSLENFSIYLDDISRIPLLTKKEEKELGYKILKKDENAINKLIVSNLRLVINNARKYIGMGLSMEDLIQEGNCGLIKAARTFDVRLGNTFSSYATECIRNNIVRGIKTNSKCIRIPEYQYENIKFYNIIEDFLTSKYGHKPDLEEIGEYLGMDLKEVTFLHFLRQSTLSLNYALPLGKEKNDFYENNDTIQLLYEDIIYDDSESVEDIVINSSLYEELYKVLDNCRLSEREREVLKLSFELQNETGMNMAQIGEMYGLKRERIRQILAKAFMKIRTHKDTKELSVYTDDNDKSLENLKFYKHYYYNNESANKHNYCIPKRVDPSNVKYNDIKIKNSRPKTIYEIFYGYSKEDIDNAINLLKPKYKDPLTGGSRTNFKYVDAIIILRRILINQRLDRESKQLNIKRRRI